MKKGFIALISTITISAVLLVISTSLAYRLVTSRSSLSLLEQKEISRGRAQVCIEELYAILRDNPHATIVTPWQGSGTHECNVVIFERNGSDITVQSEASLNSISTKTSVTFLIQNDTVSISAWEET
jgi:hypothetical protein